MDFQQPALRIISDLERTFTSLTRNQGAKHLRCRTDGVGTRLVNAIELDPVEVPCRVPVTVMIDEKTRHRTLLRIEWRRHKSLTWWVVPAIGLPITRTPANQQVQISSTR